MTCGALVKLPQILFGVGARTAQRLHLPRPAHKEWQAEGAPRGSSKLVLEHSEPDFALDSLDGALHSGPISSHFRRRARTCTCPAPSPIIGPNNEQRQQNNNCSLNPITQLLLIDCPSRPSGRLTVLEHPPRAVFGCQTTVGAVFLGLGSSSHTPEERSPSVYPTSPALTTHCCDHCPV